MRGDMEQGVNQLIAEARRNEEILRRLEAVEEFLAGHSDLASLLAKMGPKVREVYGLQAVTICLNRDHLDWRELLGAGQAGGRLPPDCYPRSYREMRLLLGGLDKPFLVRDITRPLRQCFFPQHRGLASMAVVPIRSRRRLFCTLNMGSDNPERYKPGYRTDFLQRLGRKMALGMETALLAGQARIMERREAAVEMAGAACHELAQPLTTVGFLLEKAKRLWPTDDDSVQCLAQIEAELDKINQLMHKISQVSQYATKPYVGGAKIIDLQAAASGDIAIDGPAGRDSHE